MDLEEFNSLPAEQARSLLRPCLDVERWTEVVSAGRPYDDLDRCLEAARTGAHPLTSEEIEAAMAHHPRIGALAAALDASGPVAAVSRDVAPVPPRIWRSRCW